MLPTNFKDDIFNDRRKYKQIVNEDGTISMEDRTEYEQVGDSLGAAILNEAFSHINVLSNPNLLINGDFANPVNQRGLLQYNCKARTYTIDRWCLLNSDFIAGGSLEVLPKSIRLKKGSASISINQSTEKIKHTGSLTLTVSAKSVSSNLAKMRVYLSGRKDDFLSPGIDYEFFSGVKEIDINEAFDKYFVTFSNIPIDIGYFCISIGSSLNTEDLELEFAKLEAGDIGTPFIPKNYGEELALCKRYFETIRINVMGNAPSATEMQHMFIYSVNKRIVPTFVMTSEGAQLNVRSTSVVFSSQDRVIFIVNTAGAGLYRSYDNACLFDAEIY